MTARAQRVLVARAAPWLRVGDSTVAIADLRRTTTERSLVLHRIDQPDWRLMIPADAGDDFADLPKLHAMTARKWRTVGLAAAGVAALGLAIWQGGPAMLRQAAPLVPAEISRGVGEQYLAIFAPPDKQCRAPAGRAALDKMIARILPPEGLVETPSVSVSRDATINAFALPGGQVVLYRGLIEQARSPEEVAGVLAHEFGHVQRLHGNQALIRHFGLGIFLEGLGGDVGSVAATGLFLSNTRAAEREADEEAIRFLRRAEVSATAVSDFFARMSGSETTEPRKGTADDRDKGDAVDSEDRLIDLLATHPPDADRKRRFAEAARSYTTRPVLTAAEWQALRGICG